MTREFEEKVYDLMANRPLGPTDDCLTGGEVVRITKGEDVKIKHLNSCLFCKELLERTKKILKDLEY